MNIGIKKIAELADVSASTVSHVLNGTASISHPVQERVLMIARETGYLERRMRRATVSLLSTVLTVASEETLPKSDSNIVAWSMMNTFRKECRARGVRVVPHIEAGSVLDVDNVMASIEKHKPHGVAIIQDERPELIDALAQARINAVILSGHDPTMRVNTISPSNRFGGELATQHLFSLGHRRIAHVTWGDRTVPQQRRFGFIDAHDKAGIAMMDGAILDAQDYHQDNVEAFMDDWIARQPDPLPFTAFFCGADNVAVGVIRSLQKAGLRVPEDVSVVGFDDAPFSDMVSPPLTTIHIPMDEVGRGALILLEQTSLTPENDRVARRVDIGCQLTIRDSTCPPRESVGEIHGT